MTWIMRLPGGPVVESDDFTLADLGDIERETGVPWSTLNPLNRAPVAVAFLKTAYRAAGMDPAAVDTLNLKTLAGVFDFRPDAPFPGDEEADADPLEGPSSPASSPGASDGSGGPRRKPAGNG